MNRCPIVLVLVIVIAAAGCGGGQKKDPKVAREQALEDAKSAGILGAAALEEGGVFGSLVGYGDVSTGFDDSDIYGGLTGDDYGYGGLGYGGLTAEGYGGGGCPDGGCIGTLGHGSGTGEGYGYGGGGGDYGGGYGYDTRHATSAGGYGMGSGNGKMREDRVLISIDLSADGYDAHEIVYALHDHVADFEACTKTAGTVKVTFTLGTDGTTSKVKADGIGKKAAKCVAHVIGTVAFMPPEDGVPVDVTASFDY